MHAPQKNVVAFNKDRLRVCLVWIFGLLSLTKLFKAILFFTKRHFCKQLHGSSPRIVALTCYICSSGEAEKQSFSQLQAATVVPAHICKGVSAPAGAGTNRASGRGRSWGIGEATKGAMVGAGRAGRSGGAGELAGARLMHGGGLGAWVRHCGACDRRIWLIWDAWGRRRRACHEWPGGGQRERGTVIN